MPAREQCSVGGIEGWRRTGRERRGCWIDRAARACAGGIRVARFPDRGVCRCRGGCGHWLGNRRFGRNEAKPEGEEDCNFNSWYLVVYMWKAWWNSKEIMYIQRFGSGWSRSCPLWEGFGGKWWGWCWRRRRSRSWSRWDHRREGLQGWGQWWMTSRRSGPDYWISHAGILYLSPRSWRSRPFSGDVDQGTVTHCLSCRSFGIALSPQNKCAILFANHESGHLFLDVRLRTTIIVRIVQQE